MKIGFTGTRNGMTDAQQLAFVRIIQGFDGVKDCQFLEFYHGSCQGADVEAARIFNRLHPKLAIIALPGPEGDSRQAVSGCDSFIHNGKTHFARNRDIVNACDLLIGCPKDATEQPHGGTWYTIRYAVKQSKPVKVIWPDGRVEDR